MSELETYRFDGPSPTMVSRIAPQNVRCGGRIARGNLPGVTPAKYKLHIVGQMHQVPIYQLNASTHHVLVFGSDDCRSPVTLISVE